MEPVDTWVALEDGGQYKRGDVISRDPNPVPVGSQVIGERGVTPIAGGSFFDEESKEFRSTLLQNGGFAHSAGSL